MSLPDDSGIKSRQTCGHGCEYFGILVLPEPGPLGEEILGRTTRIEEIEEKHQRHASCMHLGLAGGQMGF